MTIQVTVNGDPRDLPDGATVASVLELLHGSAGRRGIAVALSGEVVPRGAWETTRLRHGERIEVVAAVQGG